MIDFILKGNLYTKNQKFLFFTFLLMCWFNFGNYSWLQYSFNGTPYNNSLSQIIRNLKILIPFLALLTLSYKNYYRNKFFYLIKKNVSIYFLCFLFILNSSISEGNIISLVYSFWLLFSILIINLVTEEVKHINDMFRLLKFGSIITLLLVLPSLPFLLENNEATYFSSKNYYAFPLLIYFFSDIYLPKNAKRNINIIRVFINFLIFIILFLSGRRVALFCAFLCLINYFFFYNKKNIIFLLLLLSLIPTTFLSLNFFGFKISEARTFRRFERINAENDYQDSSYNERLFLWDKYMLSFKESPLIGKGLNTYVSNLKSNYSGDLEGLGYHNTYLQVLVESGIIGLSFFIAFILKSVFNLLRFSGLKYFSIILSVLLINWFETNFMPGQVFFIVTLSALFMSNSILNERS